MHIHLSSTKIWLSLSACFHKAGNPLRTDGTARLGTIRKEVGWPKRSQFVDKRVRSFGITSLCLPRGVSLVVCHSKFWTEEAKALHLLSHRYYRRLALMFRLYSWKYNNNNNINNINDGDNNNNNNKLIIIILTIIIIILMFYLTSHI